MTRAMAGISRNARVEDLNLYQPEFVKPVWDYLDSAVSPTRVADGQQTLAANLHDARNRIEAKYGVPREILVVDLGQRKQLRPGNGQLQHVRGAGDARL